MGLLRSVFHKLKSFSFKPERVPHYRDARERHRGTGEDGREEPAEHRIEDTARERDTDDVIGECPEQVLSDTAHRELRETYRLYQLTYITVQESDACALDGDVGAGRHRDADVRSRERRGVVDAVPRHRDDAALRLQLLNGTELILRHHLGHDLVDADLLRDEGGRTLIVAGEHHDLYAERVQSGDRLFRFRLQRVGDHRDGKRLPSCGKDDRGLPFGGVFLQRVEGRAELQREPRAADVVLHASNGADQSLTFQRFEPLYRQEPDVLLARIRDDGVRDRMVRFVIERG